MLNNQTLHTLLGLEVSPGFSTVLVYAEQLPARLDYTCRFIFNHVLGLDYKLTSDEAAFKMSGDIRINYSEREFDKVFRIQPNGLLNEKGVSEKKPAHFFKDNVICFFESPDNNSFSCDIFASVFYFISRYEEWQAFTPDQHQRFEVTSSLLYKKNFHLKPVVDIWIKELGSELQKFYKDFKVPDKKFRILSTIDVDNLYAYRSKGVLRTIGACAKDVLKADFKNLAERIKVLAGKKKDPFDIYENVSDFCFANKIPLIYFFLFRTGTKHDRTVNPASGAYKEVFKTIRKNYAAFGIHPSYNSSVKKELLKEEILELSEKSNEKITLSRQHYLRFNIRTTPDLLMEQGISADFTMGYASAPGFRAGTSHPFYYYSFDKEEASPLLFVPFCVMDGVYTVYGSAPAEKALSELLEIAKEVKNVNGLFVSVFHERTFSEDLYPGFGNLYRKLHLYLKNLKN